MTVTGTQASSDSGPVQIIRTSRLAAAILCGLVLGGAAGASIAWALSPQPTRDDLAGVAADLLPPGREVHDVETLGIDASGLGPTEVRGRVDPQLAIEANADGPTDAGIIGELFQRAQAADFSDVLLRRGMPAPGHVALVGERDGLAFELRDGRLDIAPLVGWPVVAATVGGAVGLALLAGFRSAHRQRRGRSRGMARLLTAGSWAILPIMAVCTASLPFFLGPGRSAADLGDYGSFVLELAVGLWAPVAILVGLIAWVMFGRRVGPGQTLGGPAGLPR
ncbi:MAG: hypothetical protein H0U22_10735 [Geodermatophilaceae bacterium]|nr:hypothetical protein [Geodermatophilaceae bacterium]